jgi:peroxiredoxin
MTVPSPHLFLLLGGLVLLLAGCGKPRSESFEDRLEAITKAVESHLAGLPPEASPDLSGELSALDSLVRKEAPANPDNAAAALARKAIVQLFYLDDQAAATLTLRDLMARFPGSPAARRGEALMASLSIQRGLVPGAWFPDFEATDLAGNPLRLSRFRGKVVLIDFWATWCPPCRADLPNLRSTYAKFHDEGFEIIGISLDRDRGRLERFLNRESVPWAQSCDGLAWESPLIRKLGVLSLPASFLLDRDGRIVARDPRGDALDEALERLFNTP